MVALQIRDVPDDVRDTLAGLAAARSQSMQSYLLDLLTDEARRSTNLALLDRFRERRDGSRLTTTELDDVLDAAHDDRAAR